MKNLYFITSGDIDYQLPGHTLYQSIRVTADNRLFPGLTKPGIVGVKNNTPILSKLNYKTIISAPSAQCQQTAKIIGSILKIPIHIDSLLLPLRFNLAEIISKEDFNRLGDKAFTLLRTRYIEAFFNNQLTEDNRLIINRLKMLQKYSNSLFVSHAYLIKLFQIYSQIGEEMFTNYKKLSKLFHPQRPTLKRLELVKIVLT